MKQMIYEGKTPVFPISIMRYSDKFPGALPLIDKVFQKIHDSGGYFNKKNLDNNRRYSKTLQELKDNAAKFDSQFNTLYNKFSDLFSDYDKEVVLPTTCALSIQKPAHTDFESLGYIGLETDFEYPKDLVATVVAHYKKSLVPSDSDYKISMPRGKNAGYPYPISGMQRQLSDILLAVSSAICLGTDKQRMPLLSDVYGWLQPFHGPAFTVQGERYQHTAKEQPIIVRDGIFSSTNFEPRVRIICMSSKISVIKDRRKTKRLLATFLNSQQHTQDRTVISREIESMASYGTLFAVDASKFDFRFGGKRGKQVVRALGEIISDDVYRDNVLTDFDTDLIVFGYGDVYRGPGDAMLKSGMGSTTLIGCFGNFLSAVFVVSDLLKISYSEAISQYKKSWNGLFWGDDAVLALRETFSLEDVKASYAKVKMGIDDEPNLKFLGYSYAKGRFKGTMNIGYSMGRAFQQQFFPERMRTYPFSTVGYLARLELMPAYAKQFHSRMASAWRTELLGEYFPFEKRHDVLRSLLPEIEKHADKISQLDDVLNLFTHGIQDLDPSLVSIDNDMMEILGNQGFADVTDPALFLEQNEKIDSSLITRIRRLSTGELSEYQNVIHDIQRIYNLQWNKGSVLY